MAAFEGASTSSGNTMTQQHSKRTSKPTEIKSPFRKNRGAAGGGGGGFIAVLRQKFTPSRNDRLHAHDCMDDLEETCRRKCTVDESSSSATLCNSWRASRPRHSENPIRPAYSDECLSCCTVPRSRRAAHSVRRGAERCIVEAALPPAKPVVETIIVKKSSGTLCKHCHSKNDRSPSEIELDPERDSTSLHGGAVGGDAKVCREILPSETAYGAAAYGHASAPVACDAVSAASDISQISPSSSCDGHATMRVHHTAGGDGHAVASCFHVCELHPEAIACEPMTATLSAVQPMQPFYDQVKEHGGSASGGKGWSLSKELFKLSNYGWYWGPITRVEAEEKLAGQIDGAFLVRDSSDDRYLLSLSFRSFGRTLHTRIEHCNGVFSFYAQPESEGYSSIVDLIEHSVTDSQSGVFCYSRARVPGSPSFPVRLAKAVSRFAQVRTLQYLCRFVIRQNTRVDHIQQLPLPFSIKGWLEEGQY